jgi:thiol-disulfide isomerase/thioredoxin
LKAARSFALGAAIQFAAILPGGILSGAGPNAHAAEPAGLSDLEGRPARVEDLRGSVAVLNFWATWCVPCREEMPLLSEIADRFGQRGVRVIGLSTDEPGRDETVRGFVKRHRIGFPIWIGGTTEDMERLDLGTALPATAVLDRDGRTAFRMLGLLRREDLEARLDWLLGDRTGPRPADRVDTFPPTAGEAHEEHGHDEADEHGEAHDHGEEESHAHGNVALEGASLVPS